MTPPQRNLRALNDILAERERVRAEADTEAEARAAFPHIGDDLILDGERVVVWMTHRASGRISVSLWGDLAVTRENVNLSTELHTWRWV